MQVFLFIWLEMFNFLRGEYLLPQDDVMWFKP